MDGMLGPLLLFAAVMSLTPGPNVVMVTASAANFGFRRVVPHMLGITTGFAVMLVAVGLGLAGLVHAVPRLHAAVQVAGALYLLYLAWRIAGADAGSGAGSDDNHKARTRPIGFVEAALFQALNPKGWTIALGAMAAFTTPGADSLRQTALVTAVNAAACLASVALWAAAGAALGRALRHPRARRIFNLAMATLLVLSLVPVFW